MGNNDALPPPPPPGFAPPPAPAPPGPPPAPLLTAPPAKKKTGLFVGIGVVVVAAVVGGVIVATRKDDTPASLGAETSVATDDTLAITVPNSTGTTAPDTTTSGTGLGDSMVTVTDDTSTFSVMVPQGFEWNSSPIVSGPTTLAEVRAAPTLADFENGDDGFGFAIIVAAPKLASATPLQALDGLSPDAGACAQQIDTDPPQATPFGDAIVRRFDGCGTGGGFGKVIMSAKDAATGAVVTIYVQGESPSSDTLMSFATVMFLTVQLL